MRSHLETAARITDSAKPTSEVVEYAVTPREKPLRFLAFRRGAFATAHQKQRHDAAMQTSEKRAKRIKKRHRIKNKTRIKKRGGSSSSVASAMHRVCRQLKRPFAPVSLSYRALSAADLGEQSGGKEHYLERSRIHRQDGRSEALGWRDYNIRRKSLHRAERASVHAYVTYAAPYEPSELLFQAVVVTRCECHKKSERSRRSRRQHENGVTGIRHRS